MRVYYGLNFSLWQVEQSETSGTSTVYHSWYCISFSSALLSITITSYNLFYTVSLFFSYVLIHSVHVSYVPCNLIFSTFTLYSDGPLYNTESLKTGAGVGITSFAKFTTFGKDLYADLVAPGLRTSLLGMSSFLCFCLF